MILIIGLLIVMAMTKRNGLRESEAPTGEELVVLVWLVGFCYGELYDIYRNGIKKYFINGWNLVDILMDFFMIITYIVWFFLLGFKKGGRIGKNLHYERWRNTLHIADGTFCIAIVFSFFRLLYLCQGRFIDRQSVNVDLSNWFSGKIRIKSPSIKRPTTVRYFLIVLTLFTNAGP